MSKGNLEDAVKILSDTPGFKKEGLLLSGELQNLTEKTKLTLASESELNPIRNKIAYSLLEYAESLELSAKTSHTNGTKISGRKYILSFVIIISIVLVTFGISKRLGIKLFHNAKNNSIQSEPIFQIDSVLSQKPEVNENFTQSKSIPPIQNIGLTIFIIDSISGNPIKDVSVSIPYLNFSAKTDELGRLVIPEKQIKDFSVISIFRKLFL